MQETLEALAEPNRRRIVELLRNGSLPVNEIVRRLGLPQPLVSKHLRVLKDAGLVYVTAAGQQRLYDLQAVPFQQLDEWALSFRRLWEERLDRLDQYLASSRPRRRTKG